MTRVVRTLLASILLLSAYLPAQLAMAHVGSTESSGIGFHAAMAYDSSERNAHCIGADCPENDVNTYCCPEAMGGCTAEAEVDRASVSERAQLDIATVQLSALEVAGLPGIVLAIEPPPPRF